MKNGRIESFIDLNVWKEGHKLVVMIYKITSDFPKSETYSLVDQMRRSAASVTANIAEGFGRQTYKEKVQFYYLSKGSLTELNNFILIAKDINYLSVKDFNVLMDQESLTARLLQGLIAKSKTFIIQKSKISNQ
jgi:four helix bundle protein